MILHSMQALCVRIGLLWEGGEECNTHHVTGATLLHLKLFAFCGSKQSSKTLNSSFLQACILNKVVNFSVTVLLC